MKKTLLAAAALMAISSVSQAAQVEVFGAVDEFVAVNSTGGKWKSALMSGGAGASHVGIKGVEDLGNGVQVFFNLDQAFLADDGQDFRQRRQSLQPRGKSRHPRQIRFIILRPSVHTALLSLCNV